MDENEYPLKVHIYGPGTWKCMPACWVGNGSVGVATFQLAEPAASPADAPRGTGSLFVGPTSSSFSLGPGRPVEPQSVPEAAPEEMPLKTLRLTDRLLSPGRPVEPQAVPGGKPEEMPSKRRRLTDRLRARA